MANVSDYIGQSYQRYSTGARFTVPENPHGNWVGYCGMYGTDGEDFYVNTYAPDGSKVDMSFSFIVTRVTF